MNHVLAQKSDLGETSPKHATKADITILLKNEIEVTTMKNNTPPSNVPHHPMLSQRAYFQLPTSMNE